MNAGKVELSALSEAMTELVSRTVAGVVAVKSAPYRVASGVILREDLVAIADHTLRRRERVAVQAADGTELTASLLGRDPRLDVAILRTEGLKLSALPVRDPASLEAGMLACVVGLTIDVGPSASLGILGAVGGSRRTWRGGILDHFLRLDVNAYPSQTGAAVVDCDGNLIGLATPGLLRHSSLAVPVVTLNRVADELLQQGRIRQGYVGSWITACCASGCSARKNWEWTGIGADGSERGAGFSAEKAGVQLGDILMTLNATPLSEVDDLQNALRGEMVGQTVEVVLFRGGEMVRTQITISERAARAQ